MNDAPDDRAKCGQCERDVSAIFCCPERLPGHCPFVEKWRGNVFIDLTWWTFAIAGVLAIGGFFGKSMWAGWATLALLVTTFVLFEITRKIRLYNSQSQVRLQRTTVAGIEWSYRWSWEVGSPVRFEPTPLLTYPPSISSTASLSGFLVSEAQAVTIVRAALIELLTKQYIKADLFRSYAVTRARPSPTVVDSYIVLVERHREGSENLGKLEKRILFVVPIILSVQSASKDSMAGLRLYDVVRAVYDRDQLDPPAWLAELVTRDAAKRDLGYLNQMWLTDQIEWDPTHLPRLREEEKIIQSLSEQFAKSYPEFSRVLDAQISSAILSRTTGGTE